MNITIYTKEALYNVVKSTIYFKKNLFVLDIINHIGSVLG